MHERSRADGERERSKGQTVGQGRSERDTDRDNARRSEESNKEQRDTSKDRALQRDGRDKGQTVGQSKPERDDARQSEDRTHDKSKADNKSNSQQSGSSGMQGQSAQDRNSSSGNQNAARNETNTQGQNQDQTNAGIQTKSGKSVTAQQQTALQQSVVQASNAPRVNANSINFQVRSGIAVPSSVTVASVSTYPALIDMFPAYRGDSFFVVEDEVVIVNRDRRIVDVIPAGPRARYAGGGFVAAVDLPPDDVRVIQRVLIDRGLLQGDADGVWGPATREAITVYQRQQGIAVTGSINMRTVSSLGVSNRLSQRQPRAFSRNLRRLTLRPQLAARPQRGRRAVVRRGSRRANKTRLVSHQTRILAGRRIRGLRQRDRACPTGRKRRARQTRRHRAEPRRRT
jgi:hypothetical protein